MQSAADAIVLHRLDGSLVDVNETACKWYGYTHDELLQLNVNQLDPDYEIRSDMGKFWEDLKKNKYATFKAVQVKKDKSFFKVENKLSIVTIDNEDLVLVVVRDITQKELIEEKLRYSEQKYRNLYERSSDPILILQDGIFVDCNQATVDVLKYDTIEDIKGMPPDILSPEFQPDGMTSRKKAARQIAMAKEQGYFRFEWIHIDAMKNEIYFDVALTYLPDESHDTYYTVWRNISDRKRAEKELELVHKNLQELVKERTSELEQKNNELSEQNEKLEKYNDLFIGREFRVKDLREQIKVMKRELAHLKKTEESDKQIES